LFRLAQDGEIELRGQVAEQDLPKIQVGQTAQVRITGIDKPFVGTVRLLGAVIDPQTRLGTVRISLAPDPNLRPGGFARAEVTISREQRAVVPQTAVLADAQGTYVMIVGADSRVERRAVRVTGTGDGGLLVSEGITGHERIVVTAGAFLQAGELVRVLADGSA
jgi:hypothetical protein